ncbi:dephospho-CoA kinase [Rothia sp. P100]|uniref:dephospho-CoA kinase n=1 Tax=Rothia sp. P100 TaxID=2939578 RepID=UPI00203DAF12|nr:dephospho-CoA kinase [Rothia sp. P100]MCM3510353.1 dephospho-CoA kinase [Rothia sp. P100]
MKRIGLTGGIGSGKSTVAQMLADRGAVIIDADAISRELMEPGSDVLNETVRSFGSAILTADGRLDRAALASVIFENEAKRKELNSIVHPAVRSEAERQAATAQADPGFSGVLIEDIPLLVETGQAQRFDGVVVVETALAERLRRLVDQRGMSRADAIARIQAQASDQERREIATWLVDNSHSLEETRRQVETVYGQILEMQDTVKQISLRSEEMDKA